VSNYVPKSLTQPLAQAKNHDQQFWKPKIHTANGKAEACTQGALVFFLLSLGGGDGRGGFFSFFLCSQHVLSMFLSSSHWVPQFIMSVLAQAKNGDKQFWK
jgi:hypothetical protein